MMKNYPKKNAIHFAKYTAIGLTASLLNIFFVWLLVDHLHVPSAIGISTVVFAIFLFKFYMYIVIKLIKSQFAKYTIIQLISVLLNIYLTWFFIEVLLISTLVATTTVVVGLFIARFILFKITKLIID